MCAYSGSQIKFGSKNGAVPTPGCVKIDHPGCGAAPDKNIERVLVQIFHKAGHKIHNPAANRVCVSIVPTKQAAKSKSKLKQFRKNFRPVELTPLETILEMPKDKGE